MARWRVPGQPPLFRTLVADIYNGIRGAAAVCAALLGRADSGKGQHIDMALYDCMISIHDYAVRRYVLSSGSDISVRTGQDQPRSTVSGVSFAVDGHRVIAAQVDNAWVRLARLIGGDPLAADASLNPASRNANRLEALALVRGSVLHTEPAVAAHA